MARITTPTSDLLPGKLLCALTCIWLASEFSVGSLCHALPAPSKPKPPCHAPLSRPNDGAYSWREETESSWRKLDLLIDKAETFVASRATRGLEFVKDEFLASELRSMVTHLQWLSASPNGGENPRLQRALALAKSLADAPPVTRSAQQLGTVLAVSVRQGSVPSPLAPDSDLNVLLIGVIHEGKSSVAPLVMAQRRLWRALRETQGAPRLKRALHEMLAKETLSIRRGKPIWVRRLGSPSSTDGAAGRATSWVLILRHQSPSQHEPVVATQNGAGPHVNAELIEKNLLGDETLTGLLRSVLAPSDPNSSL